jgi:hypothetical protein
MAKHGVHKSPSGPMHPTMQTRTGTFARSGQVRVHKKGTEASAKKPI